MNNMEAWSDKPVLENFKVKFFLDTNILVFLIDKTYSGLTKAIEIFNKSEFVDLVSSKFVIFEFVGVRKKEHYLKKSISEYSVNISTLLKYGGKGFDVPGVEFNDIQADIKSRVEKELEELTNDFGISYSENLLHKGLLKPTFDICLASKISKEDSLVLVSSLLPEPSKPESTIHLLSKDEQFTKAFNEANLAHILSAHSLVVPKVESISKLDSKSVIVNLTNSSDDVKLDTFLPEKFFEMIKYKNTQIYIGDTFPPTDNDFPDDVLCFKLPLNKLLPNNIFATIIAKDLSFIYSTKHNISEFWQNGKPISGQFSTTDETKSNISFKIHDGNDKALPLEQMNKLREQGNAVYIHPDSIE